MYSSHDLTKLDIMKCFVRTIFQCPLPRLQIIHSGDTYSLAINYGDQFNIPRARLGFDLHD
jgi:hypothetical protein